MKWFNEKGASLGFTITTALLAAIIICALFVSCGRTHSQSGVWSRGSGVKDKNGNTSTSVPDSGLKTQDSGLALDAILRDIDAYQPPKGVDAARFASLKAELKRLLTTRAAGSKSLSIVPSGTMNAVTDLAATVNPTGTQATLTWTEALPGDYDNNGVVDIGDLIPLALYFGQRTDSGPDDAHRLVNGDANPEVNIWDLGAIAGNYASHLQGYQVWRGHWNGSSTDWETAFRPNVANPSNTSFSADRTATPPATSRPVYTYLDDITGLADKTNVRYKVTAYGDGAAGAESNEAAVPATTFSVSGKVTLMGAGLAGVTLTLAPSGLHATTQADGTYAISGIANGSYTVTPTATGYVFTPAVLPVTVSGANVVGLDFTATGGLANSAWPKFHGNAQNTGQSPYIGAQTNHVKWTFQTGDWVQSSPAIGKDGTIYVGSYDRKLYALNPDDGSVKWSYTTGNTVLSSPAIGRDGTVYDGSSDYNVYAFSPDDGSVKWTFRAGAQVVSSPSVGGDGTVYVGSLDKKIYALSPGDGSIKWSCTTGDAVYASPSIGTDGTIYAFSRDKKVYALDPANGAVRWTFATLWYNNGSPAVGADGTVYVKADYEVYALDPANGSVKWSHAVGDSGWMSPATGADGTVYVGSIDGSVYALNPADGSEKWTHTTGWWMDGSATIGSDGTIYIGSGRVYALDPSDGSVKWSYTTGGRICSSPAISSDGTVYITSYDGKLYAFGGVGPSTYSVSGTVTLSTGGRLAGVTMTLTPGGKTATTASDGTYKFTDILEGTYTLTPTATGYVFTPAQRSVTVKALDVVGQDFTATGGLANSAWPKFRGNAQNTGLSRYVGAQTNHVKWIRFTARPVVSSPSIGADGTVYVGSLDSKLYALNTSDGSVKWTYATGSWVTSSAAIAVDGTVYIGSWDAKLYALNSADGSLEWSHATGGGIIGSAAISADGTVYIGSGDGKVYALNPADGGVKWAHVAGNAVNSSPVIGTDGTIYVGSDDMNVYALNPADGTVKWVYVTSGLVHSSPAISADGTVYVGSDDGKVYALNASDGSLKWSYATANIVASSPAIAVDGTIYVGSDDYNVYALNPLDGSIKWSFTTVGSVYSSPAIGADGTVYVGSYYTVYALNPSDGSVKWSYYAAGDWMDSSPAIGADGTVYVGSGDKVYAFGP
jgi:outer membrane protein assembly factor BamB